jgi:NUMOD3 motif
MKTYEELKLIENKDVLVEEYNNLINYAKFRIIDNNIYFEKHHIIPKSMNGNDTKDNIVCLLPEEHFIAHYLLWKIHDNMQMAGAFMLMCRLKRNKQIFEIEPNEYKILKEEQRKIAQEIRAKQPPPMLGKKHTDKSRKKISDNHNPNSGRLGIPFTEEQKERMSKNRKGKKKIPWTDERKQNLSKFRSGLFWWTNGITETSNKECPGEEWTRGRMYGGKNNKKS